MSVMESQQEVMDSILDYFRSVLEYADDVSSEVPVLDSFISEIDLEELETFLFAKMGYTPTLIESAVQEAYNLFVAFRRDNEIRKMGRGNYFEDYSPVTNNTVEYLESLKELQSQYITGTTPEQRS